MKVSGQLNAPATLPCDQISQFSDELDGRSCQQCEEICLYSTASRLALGPTQGVKRQGREADRSPLPSADVKNGEAMSPLPHTSSWRGAQLTNSRHNFTLYLR
jgi:hypothetical protein